MANNKIVQSASFLVVLGLAIGAVILLVWPSINILIFSAIVAVLLYPLYKLLCRYVKAPALASLLTILVFLLVLAVPLWFFGNIIFGELAKLMDYFRSNGLVIPKDKIIDFLPEEARSLIQNLSVELNNYVGRIANQVVSSATGLLSNVAGFFVAFFMFFFILFYLLKDGERMLNYLISISPLEPNQAKHILVKIERVVQGIIQGTFIISLIQGVIATVGYYLFGLPEPLMWGAFTVVAALVPNVGTSLVLVPAVIFLVITGHIPQAIGLAIWGGVAVGLVDNFLGPKLIGGRINLHPLLTLLSVIGGISAFGLIGVLLGPIIMAVFIAMLDLYRTEFKDYTNQ